MEGLGTQQKLLADMQAACTELMDGLLRERGRGFASDREVWAMLKEQLEGTAARTRNVGEIHKEMWDAVKEHNEDAFSALLGEMQRSALLMAMDWANISAAACLALTHTED